MRSLPFTPPVPSASLWLAVGLLVLVHGIITIGTVRRAALRVRRMLHYGSVIGRDARAFLRRCFWQTFRRRVGLHLLVVVPALLVAYGVAVQKAEQAAIVPNIGGIETGICALHPTLLYRAACYEETPIYSYPYGQPRVDEPPYTDDRLLLALALLVLLSIANCILSVGLGVRGTFEREWWQSILVWLTCIFVLIVATELLLQSVRVFYPSLFTADRMHWDVLTDFQLLTYIYIERTLELQSLGVHAVLDSGVGLAANMLRPYRTPTIYVFGSVAAAFTYVLCTWWVFRHCMNDTARMLIRLGASGNLPITWWRALQQIQQTPVFRLSIARLHITPTHLWRDVGIVSLSGIAFVPMWFLYFDSNHFSLLYVLAITALLVRWGAIVTAARTTAYMRHRIGDEDLIRLSLLRPSVLLWAQWTAATRHMLVWCVVYGVLGTAASYAWAEYFYAHHVEYIEVVRVTWLTAPYDYIGYGNCSFGIGCAPLYQPSLLQQLLTCITLTTLLLAEVCFVNAVALGVGTLLRSRQTQTLWVDIGLMMTVWATCSLLLYRVSGQIQFDWLYGENWPWAAPLYNYHLPGQYIARTLHYALINGMDGGLLGAVNLMRVTGFRLYFSLNTLVAIASYIVLVLFLSKLTLHIAGCRLDQL